MGLRLRVRTCGGNRFGLRRGLVRALRPWVTATIVRRPLGAGRCFPFFSLCSWLAPEAWERRRVARLCGFEEPELGLAAIECDFGSMMGVCLCFGNIMVVLDYSCTILLSRIDISCRYLRLVTRNPRISANLMSRLTVFAIFLLVMPFM